MKLEIIETSDGSQTLHLPEMNEHYHSVNGAITESNYVYIEKGYEFHPAKNPGILEIGFGTGLNVLLTALSAEKTQRQTQYITIEKFPLDKSITDLLKYGSMISEEANILFHKIHHCEWNKTVKISEYFSLLKLETDLTKSDLSGCENCDIIYFDAFGPDKQPEMWTSEIFKKIYDITSTNGLLVTYSAKGEVRRKLAACGFTMEKLPGPPGKFQMLRGIKRESKL